MIRESAENAYFAKCGLKAIISFSLAETDVGKIELTALEQVSREDTEAYDRGKKDLQ